MQALALKRLISLLDLPEVGEVFIYGTGAMGRTMAVLLKDFGRPAAAYIDSRHAGEVEGIPVIPVNDFLERRGPDDIVLICSTYVREIAARLGPAVGSRDYVAKAFLLGLMFERDRFDPFVSDGRIEFAKSRDAGK